MAYAMSELERVGPRPSSEARGVARGRADLDRCAMRMVDEVRRSPRDELAVLGLVDAAAWPLRDRAGLHRPDHLPIRPGPWLRWAAALAALGLCAGLWPS